MKIKNIGILAHIDAGKTTLSEALLYHSGHLKHLGRVDKGNTITDSLLLERERGITIKATTTSFFYQDYKINLIDTPGHMDFIGEVERSLSALDGAIILVSAIEGIEAQTKVVIDLLKKHKKPSIIFINKLDRVGVNLDDIYQQIFNELQNQCIVMQDCDIERLLIKDKKFERNELLDILIDIDQEITKLFLEEKEISYHCLLSSLKQQISKGTIYPIFHGIALKNIGINQLLEAIIEYLPDTMHLNNQPLSGYVYKIERNDNLDLLTYIRVYSGMLINRKTYQLFNRNEPIKIKNLHALNNMSLTTTDKIESGDIAILIANHQLKIGDIIENIHPKIINAKTNIPLLQVAIEPINPADRRQMISALIEISEEDPLLSVTINKETNECSVSIFGKIQMEIIEEILNKRYHILTQFHQLKIINKIRPLQSITLGISMREPDNFLAAGYKIKIEPLPLAKGFQFQSLVSYGFLKTSFQVAIYEGLKQACINGFEGLEVMDIKITMLEAEFDSVNSTPAEYRRLAPIILNKAFQQITFESLEPFYSYQIVAPIKLNTTIISQLTMMEATLDAIEMKTSIVTISGSIPIRTCQDYSMKLASLSKGKAVFKVTFLGYNKKITK